MKGVKRMKDVKKEFKIKQILLVLTIADKIV